MPGKIVSVSVSVGDSVTKGQPILILESMKMENELRSPKDGLIANIYIEAGANVEKNQVLLAIGDLIVQDDQT